MRNHKHVNKTDTRVYVQCQQLWYISVLTLILIFMNQILLGWYITKHRAQCKTQFGFHSQIKHFISLRNI